MIQYKDDQENEEEMINLAAPTITKKREIRQSGRVSKIQPTIDRKWLKVLLESRIDNLGELIDIIKEMFQSKRQVLPVQQKSFISINNNCQIPLTCTIKIRKVQEFVMPKIPKTADLIC